jgi:Ca2+-binding EF-hand superfamily protein
MSNHNFTYSLETQNGLIFAKEFFQIIDCHSNGVIKLDELLTGLVGLGVTTEDSFLKRIFKSLSYDKFITEKDYKSQGL